MSEAKPLRLYVFVRIKELPATLEIEFPNKELAGRYKSSIKNIKTKVLSSSRQRDDTVALELPRSVVNLETNRGLQGFVLHFDDGDEAADWVDAVCRPVVTHKRQIFVKQYWKGEEELKEQIRAMVPRPRAASRSDRARSPPRPASPSRTERPRHGKN